MSEVQGFLRLLGEVYDVFGLDYTMALSTRPEGYLGELELWDKWVLGWGRGLHTDWGARRWGP